MPVKSWTRSLSPSMTLVWTRTLSPTLNVGTSELLLFVFDDFENMHR